jgi:hypothetical protein
VAEVAVAIAALISATMLFFVAFGSIVAIGALGIFALSSPTGKEEAVTPTEKRATSAEQAWLDQLRAKVEDLPHADCCPAALSDYGHCECPIKDVLELLNPPIGGGPNRMEVWL